MSNFDRRALFQALQQDAANMGVTVEELIKRITSGAQVIGAGQDREMIDPPTYMSTGEGHMPQIHNRLNPDEEDDFSELVQQREQALIDAGGDDLAREAILLGHKRTELNQEAPFTRDNPRTAMNTPLGGLITCQSGGDLATAVQWSDDDVNTSACTITLLTGANPFDGRNTSGYTLVPGAGAGVELRAFADIIYGTRITQRFRVDLLGGAQLTLVASQVVVRIGCTVNPTATQVATLSAGAFLSFKAIEKGSQQMTYTQYIDAQANGSGTSVIVPPMARSLKTVYRDNVALSMEIRLLSGNNAYESIAVAANAQAPTDIPLPGGCEQVMVFNNGGGAAYNAKIVFGLSF